MEQLFILPEIRTQVSPGAPGVRPKGVKVSSNQSGTFETAFRAEEGRIESAGASGGTQQKAAEARSRRNPESLEELVGQVSDPSSDCQDMPPLASDGPAVSLLEAILLAMGAEEPTAPQGSNNEEGVPGEDAASGPDAVETAIPPWISPLILLAAAQTGEGEFRTLLRQLLHHGPPVPDDPTQIASATPGLGPSDQAPSNGGQGPPQNIVFGPIAWQQNSGAEAPLDVLAANASGTIQGTPTAPVTTAADNPETVTQLLAGQAAASSENTGGQEPSPAAAPSAGANHTHARRTKDLSPKDQTGNNDTPIVKHRYQNQPAAQANTYLELETSDPSIEEIYIEQQTGVADGIRVRHKDRPVQAQSATAVENSKPSGETASANDPEEEVVQRPAQQNAVAGDNENTAGTVTDADRQNTTDGPDGGQRADGQGLDNRQAQAADASQNRPEARSSVEQTRTVQQLGDTILRSVTLKRDRAVIQLHPPELGRVRIHLTLTHGNELRAVFVAETREARLMIESNLDALRAHLEQRGLTMTDCSVDINSNSNQGFSLRQHSGNGQTGIWWGRDNRPIASDVQDVAEAVAADTVLNRPPNGRVDLVI